MAKRSSLEHGEKGIRDENAEATSAGRPSRKKESEPINPETRLRILQQAVYDLQQAGLLVGILPMFSNGHRCACIVIEGADVDGIGNLVLAGRKGGE